MFIAVTTNRHKEQLINTDHIIRVVPFGGRCNIYLNEFDYTEDGMENLWYTVSEPKYEEIKEILCGLR